MQGGGYGGDRRVEHPTGQCGNLDISNSRKPLLPWARGMEERRCCDPEPRGCGHQMDAGTIVGPSGGSWSHREDAAIVCSAKI